MKATRIVGRDEWYAERRKLLEKEKELTRLSDEFARNRRSLAWVEVSEPFGEP